MDRPGWRSGGYLALIITGSGKRVAESFDGDRASAPQLHVKTDAPKVVRGNGNTAKGSQYTVRLHFAEPRDARSGDRVFNVILQGKEVLRDFDVIQQANGARRPVIKTFRGVRIAEQLEIELVPSRRGRRPRVR